MLEHLKWAEESELLADAGERLQTQKKKIGATGYYFKFLNRRLDQLDKYPELKSFTRLWIMPLSIHLKKLTIWLFREVTDLFISLSTALAWILSNSFGLLLRTEWSVVDLRNPLIG